MGLVSSSILSLTTAVRQHERMTSVEVGLFLEIENVEKRALVNDESSGVRMRADIDRLDDRLSDVQGRSLLHFLENFL